MPDLGAYAVEVGLAYAGSLAILAVVIGGSVYSARAVRRALETAEREDA